MGRPAGRFARIEPRRRAGRLVLGLLSDLPPKNCWAIAEWAGEAAPHGQQHLLSRASWDADAVRDDVRDYVVEHLRDYVVNETGDLKKGTHTVAVQRQYTGTAGRIENAQVAVHLVYAAARGHAAVDTRLPRRPPRRRAHPAIPLARRPCSDLTPESVALFPGRSDAHEGEAHPPGGPSQSHRRALRPAGARRPSGLWTSSLGRSAPIHSPAGATT